MPPAEMILGYGINFYWQLAHHPIGLVDKMNSVIRYDATIGPSPFVPMESARDITQISQTSFVYIFLCPLG